MTAIVGGSSGITFPTWTTSTRPSSPTTGTMGWNTDLNSMENYTGSAWSSVGGGGAVANGVINPNANTISAPYTLTANGSSSGAVVLTAAVTLSSGTRWVIS